MEIIRTERGWAGHFICANDCRFRRNTLLECGAIKIVVSTVGNLVLSPATKVETIGYDRYYETMAFHSNKADIRYHDADVSREVDFDSDRSIGLEDADDKANDMHEAVVAEITAKLEAGEYGEKDTLKLEGTVAGKPTIVDFCQIKEGEEK